MAKIFLSYGHRDAADLAERLCGDLAARGHAVWQDIDRIRAGHSWTDEIRQGVRNAEIVVALLSPHSVRRAGDAGNSDDRESVCLTELEYAVDACQIPVVPAMTVTCEPPFRIFRLQYIDFRPWQESADRYAALLDDLDAAIGDAVASGHSPVREWDWLPEPWDFGPFLAEKHRDFTGRDWIFDEIEAWRADAGAGPALLVTGGPGVGKSAIVARLVHENPGGQVLAYHCCQADTPATVEPERFVRSLAAMLSTRLEGYAEMLENIALRETLSDASTAADPASAFEAGILNPLHELPPPPEGVRYLLVDALDEAMTHPKAPTIVDLLATRLRRLPDWLRIVATTRSEPSVLRRLRGLRAPTIDAEDPRNEADVRLYARTRLARPELAGAVRESGRAIDAAAALVLAAGAGNFLFVTTALDAVQRGDLTLAQVAALPPGLGGLYQQFFDRLFVDAGVDFAPTKKVLQALVAAPEHPTRATLASATALDAEEELPGVMARLASFVPFRGGSYGLFHKSLFDWLTGWDEATDQPLADRYYASLTKGHGRWADVSWPAYEAGRRPLPAAALRYLPTHLVGAARWDDVARLLLDWRFLEAKTAGPGTTVFDLLADFELAAARVPTDHPGATRLALLAQILRLDAQFIGRHPDCLFQCCYNRGVWHDAPLSATFFEFAGGAHDRAPWDGDGAKLSAFVARWRAEKEADHPGFVWLRYRRPPPEILGTAQTAVLRGHADALKCVDLAPDGTRIASAGSDGSVRLWDAGSGQELASREDGEPLGVHALRYRPQGDVLVAGRWDGSLLLLDPDTLEEVDCIDTGSEHVASLAVSPDGTRLATGDWDGVLRLWAFDTRRELAREKGHDGVIECVAFSPDGTLLASGDTVYGKGRNRVRVWKVGGGLEQSAEHEPQAWVQDVCFSPDGGTLVWGDYDGHLELRPVDGGAGRTLRDELERPAGTLAFHPDGRHLLCGAGGAFGKAPITLWDLATNTVVRRFAGHLFNVSDLVVAADGRRFVSAGDATVRLWDWDRAATGAELVPVEPEIDTLRFATRSPVVFTAAESRPLVMARSVEDGSPVARFAGHEGGVHAIGLAPDERLLACGCGDGTVRVWHTATGDETLAVSAHQDLVGGVAFSPDGTRLASSSNDGTVRITAIPDGREIARLVEPGADWLTHLAWSPDGSIVAAGGLQSITLWSATSGAVVSTVQGKPFSHYSLCFHPDRKSLIVEGVGEELSAFACATGEAVAVTAEHDAAFQRHKNRLEPTWLWKGSAYDDQRDRDRQSMMTLVRRDTREEVAWLPMISGGIDTHPSGRLWTNRRANQVWLLGLEGI